VLWVEKVQLAYYLIRGVIESNTHGDRHLSDDMTDTYIIPDPDILSDAFIIYKSVKVFGDKLRARKRINHVVET
jgi:hypothetical protein